MIILPGTDETLRDYFQRLDGAVLDYKRLQGFLFAIACSPDPLKPSEWFELIWLDDEPQFDSEAEAKEFFELLGQSMMDLKQAKGQGFYLPFFSYKSIHEQQKLALWCEGFLMAHQYLEELWDVALMDLDSETLDDAVTAVLNLAATFSELLNTDQHSFDVSLGDGEPSCSQDEVGNVLGEAYQWFGEVLAVYAGVTRQWQQYNRVYDRQQMFLALESVAPDEPCPCASGKTFAKCCLH